MIDFAKNEAVVQDRKSNFVSSLNLFVGVKEKRKSCRKKPSRPGDGHWVGIRGANGPMNITKNMSRSLLRAKESRTHGNDLLVVYQ
jgi:hypothetical protein